LGACLGGGGLVEVRQDAVHRQRIVAVLGSALSAQSAAIAADAADQQRIVTVLGISFSEQRAAAESAFVTKQELNQRAPDLRVACGDSSGPAVSAALVSLRRAAAARAITATADLRAGAPGATGRR
jgi:carbamate kinase